MKVKDRKKLETLKERLEEALDLANEAIEVNDDELNTSGFVYLYGKEFQDVYNGIDDILDILELL